MGDTRKLNMRIKDAEDDKGQVFDVEMQKRNQENVPEDCDERLKHLHKKIYEIKSNEQMGVSYMKMEERDRLLVEKGEIAVIVAALRKKIDKGYTVEKMADELELEKNDVKIAVYAINKYQEKSNQEIAEMILYHEV